MTTEENTQGPGASLTDLRQLVRDLERDERFVAVVGALSRGESATVDGAWGSSCALALAGIQAELIDSACCGMAGTFGFETEHYEMSKAMGSMMTAATSPGYSRNLDRTALRSL